MAQIDGIKINVSVGIPADTAARCLSIIEMFLDDNPHLYIENETENYADGKKRNHLTIKEVPNYEFD